MPSELPTFVARPTPAEMNRWEAVRLAAEEQLDMAVSRTDLLRFALAALERRFGLSEKLPKKPSKKRA